MKQSHFFASGIALALLLLATSLHAQSYRATASGMALVPVDNPKATDVLVNGTVVDSLAVNGGLLVRIDDAAAEITTVRSRKPQRMAVKPADRFSPDEAEMIEAMDGEAEFTAGDKPVFVFGFDNYPVALDRSDPDRLEVLRGAVIRRDGGYAIYLQVPAGTEVGVYEVRAARSLLREQRIERMQERLQALREFRAEVVTLIETLRENSDAVIDPADYPRHVEKYGEARFLELVDGLRPRFAPKPPKVPGMVIVESERSFDETWATLIGSLEANPNIGIVTNIDHSAAADMAGLDPLAPNRVVVFGNPALGTPLMIANQTTGIDLPQKIHVFEQNGKIYVGFNDVTYLRARHRLGDQPTLEMIAGALRNLTANAADTEIDEHRRHRRLRCRSGLTTVASNGTVDETWDRLLAAIEASPANIAFTVDHEANADRANLDLRPTRLVVFGNPNLGTPLMQEKPSIGIDLPLKILVWEDAKGDTFVTTNDIESIARRHGVREADLAPISGAISNFLGVAAGN